MRHAAYRRQRQRWTDVSTHGLIVSVDSHISDPMRGSVPSVVKISVWVELSLAGTVIRTLKAARKVPPSGKNFGPWAGDIPCHSNVVGIGE